MPCWFSTAFACWSFRLSANLWSKYSCALPRKHGLKRRKKTVLTQFDCGPRILRMISRPGRPCHLSSRVTCLARPNDDIIKRHTAGVGRQAKSCAPSHHKRKCFPGTDHSHFVPWVANEASDKQPLGSSRDVRSTMRPVPWFVSSSFKSLTYETGDCNTLHGIKSSQLQADSICSARVA